MGEKANLIEPPASAPGILTRAGDAAGSMAGHLTDAAVAGVTGVVTVEVSDRLKSQIHPEDARATGPEEPDNED